MFFFCCFLIASTWWFPLQWHRGRAFGWIKGKVQQNWIKVNHISEKKKMLRQPHFGGQGISKKRWAKMPRSGNSFLDHGYKLTLPEWCKFYLVNHGRPASLTSASGFTTRDMKMNGSKEQRCEVDVPGMIPFAWTCDHLGRQTGLIQMHKTFTNPICGRRMRSVGQFKPWARWP